MLMKDYMNTDGAHSDIIKGSAALAICKTEASANKYLGRGSAITRPSTESQSRHY
jgi:hypothetical protein